MVRILRGDILWADLDPVRGREQAGQRPVLATWIFLILAAGACSPSPPPRDSAAAPAAAFVQVSSGGPGDAALARCLGGSSALRFEREPHAAVNPKDPAHIIASWMVAARGGDGAIQAAASF